MEPRNWSRQEDCMLGVLTLMTSGLSNAQCLLVYYLLLNRARLYPQDRARMLATSLSGWCYSSVQRSCKVSGTATSYPWAQHHNLLLLMAESGHTKAPSLCFRVAPCIMSILLYGCECWSHCDRSLKASWKRALCFSALTRVCKSHTDLTNSTMMERPNSSTHHHHRHQTPAQHQPPTLTPTLNFIYPLCHNVVITLLWFIFTVQIMQPYMYAIPKAMNLWTWTKARCYGEPRQPTHYRNCLIIRLKVKHPCTDSTVRFKYRRAWYSAVGFCRSSWMAVNGCLKNLVEVSVLCVCVCVVLWLKHGLSFTLLWQ